MIDDTDIHLEQEVNPDGADATDILYSEEINKKVMVLAIEQGC